MVALQQLFKLKPANQLGVPNPTSTQTDGARADGIQAISNQINNTASGAQTYRQIGILAAGACNGNLDALDVELNNALQRIKAHQANNHAIQEAHQAKINQDIAVCQKELDHQDELEEGRQKAIGKIEEKINELDRQISHIKANPEELDANPMSKIGVYIGGTILVFLTLYLFVFYSSASYSAFFKNFSPDDTAISQAIFDAQALSAAWDMGVTALIFILLIPFVFLGLGFLIHKFQEKKNGRVNWPGYLKSFALISITFIFDVILAYEITEKLYELKRAGSFESMPPYSFSMAIENVNFWVIIFSGFLVYLIWGFVFDFTMESYQDMDKVYVKARQLEELKKIHLSDIEKEKKAIDQIQEERRRLQTKLTGLQNSLGTIVFDMVEIGLELGNFFSGWLIFVSNQNQPETDKHVKIYESFLNKNEIQTINVAPPAN
ncbi:hypothetical protein [Porphyromonas sp. COT-239 OH1446]|uniref:hypothetical protein n=1 Tax=Porphyromonas sp. COT-239 OH1446 TaxID=1515613 RepID=UPI00068C61A0|nr:hypothetical protein [Porphyromonas sp. COT-239 OH1446]